MKIDEWLQECAPVAAASLLPPAVAAELEALEKQLPRPAPSGLRQWLAVHNGQSSNGPFLGLIDGWHLLPAGSIGETHATFNRLLDEGDFDEFEADGDGRVKPEWWNKGWIPFAEGPGGDYLCIDMDPDEGGNAGQVIRFWHDDGDRKVRARNLTRLFEEFLEDLRDGSYQVSGRGGLIPTP